MQIIQIIRLPRGNVSTNRTKYNRGIYYIFPEISTVLVVDHEAGMYFAATCPTNVTYDQKKGVTPGT